MKKVILIAALTTFAAVPAQAHNAKWHHHRHAAAAQPATVMLDGKEYKVCMGNVTDDCVNPRQAGLHFGDRPTETYRPHDMDRHP